MGFGWSLTIHVFAYKLNIAYHNSICYSVLNINVDIKFSIIKQTKQIKIQECLAILDINNDSSVVILQIKFREFLVENILE
jgi:hypothetical protein